MTRSQLYARLSNWGCWLTYEAEIGPAGARCISIESRHLPDAGDVWDEVEPCQQTPDVPDAEAMQQLIRQLDHVEQVCLAQHYGGIPAVFRYRRIGEHAMQKLLENAEIMLCDMLRKTA